MIFKSAAANKMMLDYDERGLAYIIENYTDQHIADMIQPDETSQVNSWLGHILITLQAA